MRVPIVLIFQPQQRFYWVTWFFWDRKNWWYRGPKRCYDGWLFGRLPYPSFMDLNTLWNFHVNDLVYYDLEIRHYVQKPLKLSFWEILLGEQNTVVQTSEPWNFHAHWFWLYIRSQTCKFCLHAILQSLQPSDHWYSWWRRDGVYGSQNSDLIQL